MTELETWYQRDTGRYLRAATRRNIQESLATSFGYHILQLGMTGDQSLLESSRISHRIYAGETAGTGVSLVCQADELPLDSDSIDVVIVHHGLEFSANPHGLLREAQRVLTSQGHLLIIGFNPWSLQGINSRLRAFSRKSFWREQQFVSEQRLTDWLHLLGCEVQSGHRLHHLPLVGGGRLRETLTQCNSWCDRHNLPTGSLYIVHAIKQVAGSSRPRRTLEGARQRLIGLAVPKPSAAPSPTPIAPIAPTGRRGDVAA